MAQFIVRNLEEDVKTRLKRRAAYHGRSMEEEVRHILRVAVKEQNQRVAKLGSRIAAHFAKAGSPRTCRNCAVKFRCRQNSVNDYPRYECTCGDAKNQGAMLAWGNFRTLVLKLPISAFPTV